MKTLNKVIYLFVIILGFILYLGLKELDRPDRKSKAAEITNKIILDEQVIPSSVYQVVGSSSFKINPPYQLIESSLSIPEVYRDRIEKMEVFEFVKNSYFEGEVTYIKWFNSVSYDLNSGMDGTIDNIRKLPGVEKVVDNRTLFENKKYQAYFYDAIMLRDSKSGIIKGAIFKSRQETWLISMAITESKYENIINEILESLKENR